MTWPPAPLPGDPTETESHGEVGLGVQMDQHTGEHTLWVQTTGGPPKPARRLHTQPTSFYSSPLWIRMTVW